MNKNVADMIRLVKDENIKFVDLRFTDTRGKEQHLSFPAAALDEDKFRNGHTLDGSSISGWKRIEESDITLIPDSSILFQPLIEEPSKVCPFLNLSSSRAAAGKERCCSLPRVSVKRKSTNLMFSSFTSRIMSATFLFIPAPVVLCA